MKELFKKTIGNPFLWLAILIFLLYGRILCGDILFKGDIFPYQFPEKFLIRKSLLNGIIPLVNQYILCGTSFIGNMDAGALNPMNFLLIAGDFLFGFHLFVFAHFLLAGFCMFCFLRYALKTDKIVSIFGGLAYTFGYVWSSSGNGFYRCAFLVPLFFLFFMRMIKGKRECKQASCILIVLSALSLGLLFLCGNFLEAYFTAIFAVGFLVFRLIHEYWHRSIFRFDLIIGSFVIFFTAGLIASPGILPAILCSMESYREHGIGLTEAEQWSFPPARIIEYLIPFFFGSRQGNGLWVGGIYKIEETFSKTGLSPWSDCIFVGLPVIFGFLLFLRSKVNWLKIFLLLCLIFSFIVALGKYTPIYGVLYYCIPGFKMFRHPEKFIFFVQFWLVAIGCVGLSSIKLSEKIKIKYMSSILKYFIFAVAAMILLSSLIFLFNTEKLVIPISKYGSMWDGDRIFLWELKMSASSLFFASLLFLGVKFIKKDRKILFFVFSAVSFMHFIYLSHEVKWTIPEKSFLGLKTWTDNLPEFDRNQWRIFNAGNFVYPVDENLSAGDSFVHGKLLEFSSLDCNASSFKSIRTVSGFSPILNMSYSEFMNFEKNDPEMVLDSLAVKYIAVNRLRPEMVPKRSRIIFSDKKDGVMILENTDAVPRIKAYGMVFAGVNSNLLKTGSDVAGNCSNSLNIESIPPDFASMEDTNINARVKILEEISGNKVKIAVENGPAWICLRDWFLEGWTCKSSRSGNLEIVKAGAGTMAVFSKVENDILIFEYVPPGFKFGIVLMLTGMMALFLYCWFNIARISKQVNRGSNAKN